MSNTNKFPFNQEKRVAQETAEKKLEVEQDNNDFENTITFDLEALRENHNLKGLSDEDLTLICTEVAKSISTLDVVDLAKEAALAAAQSKEGERK